MKKPKVISIVGPTSAGKTSLSIAVSEQFNGEVISADSRQVYKGMDLGTGKVTPKEMGTVPHYLLDVADPSEVYTAMDFERDGTQAIKTIVANGHLPVIAGGTFFYVDMLLGRTSTPTVPPNETLRAVLEQKSAAELYEMLTEKDPERASQMDPHNARRLVRSLEIVAALGKVPPVEQKDPYDVLTLGISIDKETLHANIHTRLLERLEDGMIAEVESLLQHGITHKRLEDLGLEYRYISRHLQGELTYDEMLEQLETKIKQFAKRQLTWLKRDSSIVWVDKNDLEHVFEVVTKWLTH